MPFITATSAASPATSAANPTPPTEKPQDLNNVSITIGAIILISGLVATVFAGIQKIVDMTTKANAAKSGLDRMDLLINSKLDGISIRLEAGFLRIDKEYLRMDRRINQLQARCRSIEMYLSSKGYAVRASTEDDSQ